ncbi:hypothetical protein [Lacipirellula parvula]|uniref:Uncharacterized protein n=1 Tax=Lacipirellula parvula TaxID=2650471 RepID=A0A5K7XCG8_9BACT|nr:hypothetical protein [Lacipirellula parvula]BBO32013.1 hypothetical protein PLANPX_1625 [Lacipirellula parvula]
MRSPAQPEFESVDPVVAGILKRMSVAERIALVEDSNQVARLLMAGGIRYRHPDWSESQVEAEVARRLLCDAD